LFCVKIEIWSDVACPWCFIGLNRFQAALDAFEHREKVTVRLRSFQLDPTLPEAFSGSAVDHLAQTKGLTPERAAAMTGQVAAVGAADGLTLNFDTVAVANSRRAHRVLHAAQRHDPSGRMAWELKQALFAAHFTEGRSIGDATVLTELATAAGLPEAEVMSAWESEELDGDVSADIEKAQRLGIQGVPTFVFEDTYGISGAQPTAAFSEALNQLWGELNPKPLNNLGTPGRESGLIDGCAPAC
jgi:predicted DsbA family dithiol-disulfide isomerase